MVDAVTEAYLLTAADAVLFLLAGLQLLGQRRRRLRPRTLPEAFLGLGESLKFAFPDLPVGFTWREGLARARNSAAGVKWQSVERALDAYEGYRYGRKAAESQDYSEVAKLANVLRGRP